MSGHLYPKTQTKRPEPHSKRPAHQVPIPGFRKPHPGYPGWGPELPSREEEQNDFTPHQVDKYYPEWSKDNVKKHYSAENERLAAELILEETKALINETKAKQKQDEKELTSRFKSRVGDIKFWQSELNLKLAKLRDELEELECQKNRVSKGIESIIEPINVIEKCIVHRGKRQGPDLVDDNVQKHLQFELETFKNTMSLLKHTESMMSEKIRQIRKRKFEIIKEITDKDIALEIDQQTSNLRVTGPMSKNVITTRYPTNTTSKNSSRYGHHFGVDKNKSALVTPSDWSEFTQRNLSAASDEIKKVLDTKSKVDGILATSSSKLRSQKELSDRAFEQRIQEVKDAKSILEMQLSETIAKIAEMEQNIISLESAVSSKHGPLATTQQKLQQRKSRPNIELVIDEVEIMLHKECENIIESINKLETCLLKSRNSHISLQKTQLGLEEQIKIKANSIYIDEVKCATLRKGIKIHAY
ncbi:tektin-1 [Lepeophtheirus salmonis]|uniref:tektin-1 n=1 Tax=Lepeophtheirus salmonis TaxID=72036 RepID=UPI001AE6328F|nr:tektin-1-like [Lepeophtheirus salmonis]